MDKIKPLKYRLQIFVAIGTKTSDLKDFYKMYSNALAVVTRRLIG